jgi:hypothetical protein
LQKLLVSWIGHVPVLNDYLEWLGSKMRSLGLASLARTSTPTIVLTKNEGIAHDIQLKFTAVICYFNLEL